MKQKVLYILIAGILLLTACGGSNADTTPTLEVNAIQTQAMETISAVRTQTALAAPTTPSPTPTMLPTFAPVTTDPASTLPAAPQATISPTASCYQLRFVSDVSIPDNTQMAPGQSFTKTWKVTNTGTCTWDAGFIFTFVGGEQMSGAAFTLPSPVSTGAELDISIPMVAPADKTGTLRGNWRMQTAGGAYFGDEVYVVIIVGGLTLTSTSIPPTATTEPTATETTTP